MALNADEIVVGADGTVNVAPVGTAGPTDIVTALDAAFVDLGYVSEDGIEMTPGMDITEVPAWQSFYAVRRIVTSRSFDLGFELLQWNETSLVLAFGGGTVATAAAVHTYSPPSPEVIDYRALVVSWADGTKDYRLHVPKVLVTDTSAINVNRSDAAGISLTFSVQATDGSDPFTLITNDPAFAA